MRINHNVAALNAWRNLTATDQAMKKSLERLSSGRRINRAADDAAGLAISEKMRAQVNGLNQAIRNAQDGISLIQTAEGALEETHNILQRMSTLSLQAASDTLKDSDREEIQKEISNLKSEIDRIANTTEFNSKKLLDGSIAEATTAQGTILQSVETQDASTGTAATATTTLVNLGDAEGNSYGLADTNVIEISGIVGGEAKTGSLTITGTSTLGDLATEINTVLGSSSVTVSTDGRLVVTGADGTANAISNLKLSVDGKVLFSNELSAFEETQAAQDNHTDASLNIQVGANAGQVLTFGIRNMTLQALSLSSVDVSTQQGATVAKKLIDNTITTVSNVRADLGALQNRLEHTINNLGVAAENLSEANSRVRDVDMALEMANFTKNQILVQAGTAMLAQANSKPQSVLQLLR